MSWRKRQAKESSEEAIARQAASWVARRDIGLTPAEQDDYTQWLTADPRHAAAIAQHAAAFERMMRLYDWQPGPSSEPNPDLFAPRRSAPWRVWGFALAAAAALAVGTTLWWSHPARHEAFVAQKSHLRVNERQALADGSLVEIKDGSRIDVEFSETERRVRLVGEAHFTVAKSVVPFVVYVGEVKVRALGTSFNVRLEPDNVEVLVTGGVVAVDKLAPTIAADAPALRPQDHSAAAPPHVVTKGQRAVVPLAADVPPQVSDVTAEQIKDTLAWQTPRLHFYETALGQAVQEFNRHNRVRLVVATRELAAVPVGGSFRVDNPEGFVRSLAITLGVKAEPRGSGEIVLSREP